MNFEEAEFGFRKAVEFEIIRYLVILGWYSSILGEFESAIQTLLQASEYYPEENEVEYRLAGLYFMIQDNTKAKFHLSNGLRLNWQLYYSWRYVSSGLDKKMVQNYIAKHKK
jgi:tetratricopeptide (TPR) repeat protein